MDRGILLMNGHSLHNKCWAGFIIGLFLICFFPRPVRGVIIDRVVAVVNGELITLSDVLQEEYPMRRGKIPNIPQQTPSVNKEILESLIGKKLLLQQAEKRKLKVPEEQLQAALTDVARQYGLKDVAQLKQALLQQGLTLERLKREIENQIKITKLTTTEVRSRILITPVEVEKYYQEHLEDYQKKEEIKGRHLLLPLAKDALPQEAARVKDQAQYIMDKLNQGADLEQIAKDIPALQGRSWSELGYFKRGELIPQLEQALWDLKMNEAAMVRTHLGYHVVQLTDRVIHTLKDNPQIKQEIENILFQQKLKQQSQRWLENLRQQATIDILP
jgi:peptidyl-prolyl cis-trans isomerase SurA